MMGIKFNKITAMFTILIISVTACASIDGTAHDLSAVPGGNKCSFCHTPHGALPGTALWNRELSKAVYKIYQSSSTDAEIGQPTGSSKLCLSCHDGTIAMNSTFDNPGGTSYIQGRGKNLGTDLSDDHPISFYYSPSISAKDFQIKPAHSLPEQLKLDKNEEVQCTTCHDPHEDKFGKMLLMSNQRSQLCLSCHDLDGWRESVHSNSAAMVTATTDTYLRGTGFNTVEANGCLNCHRLHSAGRGEYLLHFADTEDNCLNCHDGTVASTDLTIPLKKVSRHDVRGYDEGIHEPFENSSSMKAHVECSDCHNPHAIRSGSVGSSVMSGPMWKVSGVTDAGTDTTQAANDYNVCFKCHASNPNRTDSAITRQITQTNTLMEFGYSAISRHPIITVGKNKHVPSLKIPLTVNSTITCTDCHNSDPASAVKGPHGSIYRPLLKYNYETQDFTGESEFAYRLCYECHSRDSILDDQSFPFHSEHLEHEVPCSACHDAHGVDSAQGNQINNTHLMNFDINIVQQNPDTGKREFVDMGTYKGKCSLLCHEIKHTERTY